MLRFFPPALLRQQLSQPPGVPRADGGAGAKYLHGLVQVPALGQQPGQRPGGGPVAGVGPGTQLLQVPAVGQQAGQLRGGVQVADVGGEPVEGMA